MKDITAPMPVDAIERGEADHIGFGQGGSPKQSRSPKPRRRASLSGDRASWPPSGGTAFVFPNLDAGALLLRKATCLVVGVFENLSEDGSAMRSRNIGAFEDEDHHSQPSMRKTRIITRLTAKNK
ncbi:hypothetical protein GR138_26185 [Shinella kummerowiae]|jgi:hypothetical protein|uniref:Uncharacterized protein n=1 Tax=Shinella kummerowiae TaxID=417745 RepID=A0A6N8SJX7_9HYPH|nr:hypothetical protein [Shinella kummerowiae]MXN48697.1 hypothetical protein [Shinella kummerowiae]